MSLEAWGDEGDHAPEGCITEEESNELIEEARTEGIAEGLERVAKLCRTEAERLRKIHQANPSVIVECGICTASELEAGIRALAPAKQPDAEGGQLEKWLGNCVCSDNGEKCWQNRRGPLCTQDTSDSLLAALPAAAVPEGK